MRGKERRSAGTWRQRGITPAYAGKSRVRRSDSSLSQGSPPRMRGKGMPPISGCHRLRITPAYAGKSQNMVFTGVLGRDHPRVCGEKPNWEWNAKVWLGSPPRMRGKEKVGEVNTYEKRITPAYAGKSCVSELVDGCCWDHPRVCGEKLLPVRSHSRAQGITPAYAGKSLARRCAALRLRDHPRVCGEKQVQILRVALRQGSPPRMRGKV